MRRFKVTSLFMVLCLFTCVSAEVPQTGPALHLVQKIYVEEMGTSPEAGRLRLLLEDELSDRGFTVVDSTQKADAILSGVTSVADPGIHGGPADIAITARLTSTDGSRLWSTNIGGQRFVINPIKAIKFKEPVEHRAQELAKRLRSDWEKSVKVARVRMK